MKLWSPSPGEFRVAHWRPVVDPQRKPLTRKEFVDDHESRTLQARCAPQGGAIDQERACGQWERSTDHDLAHDSQIQVSDLRDSPSRISDGLKKLTNCESVSPTSRADSVTSSTARWSPKIAPRPTSAAVISPPASRTFDRNGLSPASAADRP